MSIVSALQAKLLWAAKKTYRRENESEPTVHLEMSCKRCHAKLFPGATRRTARCSLCLADKDSAEFGPRLGSYPF